MEVTPAFIKERYPLPAYNYKVIILTGMDVRDESKGEAPTVSFSQVTGLSIDYEKVEYRHGRSFQEGVIILPGIQQSFQITLTKGVVKNKRFLYDWMYNGSDKGAFQPVKRNILIDLCDEKGAAVIRWIVQGALPIKLAAPTFDANTNEVAIESLELSARKLMVDYNPLGN